MLDYLEEKGAAPLLGHDGVSSTCKKLGKGFQGTEDPLPVDIAAR